MSNLVDIVRPAAEEGNIDLLYSVLKNNPSILADIDSEQLVETPLHIAASKGHIPFVIEIMNWKPSFALKLNPEGLSPIPLAIQNKRMMLWFVDMNKELVRVKGKGGLTPLHLASQIGDVDILAVLIRACPDSLQDVTVWGETALHIAAKNNNYDALHLLVSFLRNYAGKNAESLEKKILNWKDEDDNTILHISVQNNHPKKTILLLIRSPVIYLNAKNLKDKTTLDMAISEEIKKLLSRSGVKPGSEVINSRTQAERISSPITIIGFCSRYLNRFRSTVSDEQHNILLIIFTLIVTATYQTVLSPPGGLHQSDAASDNNANIISSNSTISSTLPSAGKSVMSKSVFFWFSYLNMISFSISMIIILVMAPRGMMVSSPLLMLPMSCFAISYLYSMWMISPTHSNTVVVLTYLFVMLVVIIISQYYRLKLMLNRRKVIVTR
ncbi:ankyrin repeat-containing protein BDA1-like isoform X1 [Trifolium pratense]|uniref:ankyrin repeat-containing protein BDA1-like isoform X1 n=1 Tax=Trifolium pratense TaxID=57577 RepID=UPI001E696026|nr:ankyrin repeat-containing protein BDA1-like isoform X1 [Trifolium pratense]